MAGFKEGNMKFLRSIATAAVIGVLFACTTIAYGQTDNCIALSSCASNKCSQALITYNRALAAYTESCTPIGFKMERVNGQLEKVPIPNPKCGKVPKPSVPTLGTAAATCLKQYKCTSGAGQYVLDYEIADLMYSPPGKKSSVTYTNSSAVGSSWGLTLGSSYTNTGSVGAGVTVGAPGVASFSSSATVSSGTGNSSSNAEQLQITNTIAQATGLTSPSTDSVNHGEDEFFIWAHPTLSVMGEAEFNPNMLITQGCDIGPGPIKIGINGPGAAGIVTFTANELLGNETVPANKAAAFADLTSADKQAILATDPFIPGTITSPPSPRFSFQLTLQEDGPDNPSDDVVTNSITLTSQVSQTSTATETQTVSSGVGVNASASGGFPNIIAGIGVQFTATISNNQVWTTSASTSTGSSTATQVTAATTLATSTVGFEDLIDIYMDQLYHTFVFVSETGGKGIPASEAPTVSGTVTRLGAILPNQLVVLTFPNGVVRHVMTNAKGVYRVYRAPSGVAKVVAAGQAAPEITIESEKPIVKNIELM